MLISEPMDLRHHFLRQCEIFFRMVYEFISTRHSSNENIDPDDFAQSQRIILSKMHKAHEDVKSAASNMHTMMISRNIQSERITKSWRYLDRGFDEFMLICDKLSENADNCVAAKREDINHIFKKVLNNIDQIDKVHSRLASMLFSELEGDLCLFNSSALRIINMPVHDLQLSENWVDAENFSTIKIEPVFGLDGDILTPQPIGFEVFAKPPYIPTHDNEKKTNIEAGKLFGELRRLFGHSKGYKHNIAKLDNICIQQLIAHENAIKGSKAYKEITRHEKYSPFITINISKELLELAFSDDPSSIEYLDTINSIPDWYCLEINEDAANDYSMKDIFSMFFGLRRESNFFLDDCAPDILWYSLEPAIKKTIIETKRAVKIAAVKIDAHKYHDALLAGEDFSFWRHFFQDFFFKRKYLSKNSLVIMEGINADNIHQTCSKASLFKDTQDIDIAFQIYEPGTTLNSWIPEIVKAEQFQPYDDIDFELTSFGNKRVKKLGDVRNITNIVLGDQFNLTIEKLEQARDFFATTNNDDKMSEDVLHGFEEIIASAKKQDNSAVKSGIQRLKKLLAKLKDGAEIGSSAMDLYKMLSKLFGWD